jgi:hypothetical protein
VIVLNIEFEPAELQFPPGPDGEPEPPAPTVIGYPVAVTVTAVPLGDGLP